MYIMPKERHLQRKGNMHHQEAGILPSSSILARVQQGKGEVNCYCVTEATEISAAATKGTIAMSGNKRIHQLWSTSQPGLWKPYCPSGPPYSTPWLMI